jgi:integrase
MFVMREVFIKALTTRRPVRRSPSDLVFPNGISRASRLKVDAKRVGVACKDEQGRFADFHVLRHTWATFMRKHGIADNFAMKQIHHQSIRQTDEYADEVHWREILSTVTRLPAEALAKAGHLSL